MDDETLTRGEDYTLRMEFLSATATIYFTVTATGAGGSVAVVLAVEGLWAVLPGRLGR